MKWVAISGSWRTVDRQVENDVRHHVSGVMQAGDGIVSGGALGVDFLATDEALKANPSADRIKIILPTPFPVYKAHFRQRAQEGVITLQQAETLIAQLEDVQQRNPAGLVEMFHSACTQHSYYARNTAVIEAADSLSAFQVNDSQGTQDAIDKAISLGLSITHFKYKI